MTDEERVARQSLQRLVREVFATEAGRELMAHLISRFEVRKPVFRPEENLNKTAAAIRDGQREVVEYLEFVRTTPVEKWQS